MKAVKPKKNLGQHFLTDLNIAKRIADTVDACPDIPVLEIGPGMGVLTQYLVEKPRPVKAVEIDSESVAYLHENFPTLKDNIIGEDFLRMDLNQIFDGKGEICIRIGDDKPIGLFKYYYRDEKQTKSVWHDGYYHTGDMAWRDEEGYFWFEGRIDDVFKSSGYRIGPFEVENALMTHPAVVECAITGVPDPIRGMVVKATVVLKDEYKSMAGPDLIKKLQDHVKHETAPYKYPRIIEFADELPKTISGKIRRVEIREKDNKKK